LHFICDDFRWLWSFDLELCVVCGRISSQNGWTTYTHKWCSLIRKIWDKHQLAGQLRLISLSKISLQLWAGLRQVMIQDPCQHVHRQLCCVRLTQPVRDQLLPWDTFRRIYTHTEGGSAGTTGETLHLQFQHHVSRPATNDTGTLVIWHNTSKLTHKHCLNLCMCNYTIKHNALQYNESSHANKIAL